MKSMKMPDKLDSKLLAPCGINCISCERYQNPCAGCLIGDDYCGRCSEFPCPQMKKHSKKYIKRYDLNTLESAKRIKNMGIGKITDSDREKWTCPQCGGVIKFQTKKCSECDYSL